MKDILYVENAHFASATKHSIKLKNVITKKVTYYLFEDIDILIFTHPKSYFTQRFVRECVAQNILIIFCDYRHAPVAVIQQEHGYSRKLKRLQGQLKLSQKTKGRLWQKIVKQKISNQIYVLQACEVDNKIIKEMEILKQQVKVKDQTSREGVAARLYFREVFGQDFKRYDDDIINQSLNYCYAIVRAIIRQHLVGLGLEPALGIHHKSTENPFNLSDDVIECFRPIVDLFVHDIMKEHQPEIFDKNWRRLLPNVLLEKCLIDNKIFHIPDAIRINCESLAHCIENDTASGLKLVQVIDGGR